MLILLLIFITVYLLVLATNMFRASTKSTFTFSLIVLIICQITWLWNVGVLYLVDFVSVEESEFLFRLTRFGSLMTPTFLFLAISESIKHSQESFGFLNKVFTRMNFYIYFGITLIFYGLNWTPLTVKNLYFQQGKIFDLYFPEYGVLGWVQLFQISTLLIWLMCAIYISRSMKNVYLKAFLFPFSTFGMIASILGLMSFLKDLVIITNILSVTTFTAIILYSFNNFREKVSEHNRKLEIEKLKRNHVDFSTSSLVHELRNPLSVLQGYFYLLNDNENLDSDAQRIIKILERSSTHIQSVLDNFVDFVSNKEVKLKRTNICETVRQSIDMMQHKANNVSVVIHPLECEKECHVLLDESKFSQVLINLYKNSIEEMEHVSNPRNLFTRIKVIGNELQIEIEDTGRGVPENILKKIFQPFNTFKEEGMGLGLSISRNIISAHKGEIQIKKTDANGTTFLISLPIEDYTTLFA